MFLIGDGVKLAVSRFHVIWLSSSKSYNPENLGSDKMHTGAK